MEAPYPIVGSITSFTPDHGWIATFTSEGETWTEPIIGWAVVVDNADLGNIDQVVQPMVIDEGRFVLTLSEYLVAHQYPDVKVTREPT